MKKNIENYPTKSNKSFLKGLLGILTFGAVIGGIFLTSPYAIDDNMRKFCRFDESKDSSYYLSILKRDSISNSLDSLRVHNFQKSFLNYFYSK